MERKGGEPTEVNKKKLRKKVEEIWQGIKTVRDAPTGVAGLLCRIKYDVIFRHIKKGARWDKGV